MYKYYWIILFLISSYRSYSTPCPVGFTRPPSEKRNVQLIDIESGLLTQGFSKYYTNRFNEAIRLVSLKKHWKKLKVDPKRKHLPYFAQKVDAHIQEIQRGIEISELPMLEKRARLRVLKALKREAHLAKRTYKVTYNWWNIFNVRLIALVTTSIEEAFTLGLSLDQIQNHQEVYKRVKEKRDSLHAFKTPYVQMLEEFPNIVLVPSISEVGPMAFNQTMSESIHFMGVSGADERVDGKILSPQDYFRHDGEHAGFIEEYLKTQDLSVHSQFKFKIRDLPKESWEQQEFAYYLLLRERGILRSDDNGIFQRNLSRFLRNSHDINLLPEVIRNRQYTDREEYEQVLREYFDDMESNYNAISQEIRNSN